MKCHFSLNKVAVGTLQHLTASPTYLNFSTEFKGLEDFEWVYLLSLARIDVGTRKCQTQLSRTTGSAITTEERLGTGVD